MFSFKERMGTFAKWPENYGVATPEKLSIAGFICLSTEEDNLTVECVYCHKTLECWERTDLPSREHYLHMSKCPLFNVNRMESRVSMFDGWDAKEAKALARIGFVKYNIGDADFIFCYKCGSIDKSHQCKRKRGCVYNVDRSVSIFFYNLIEGVYNEELTGYIENTMYIPQQSKEFLEAVAAASGMPVLRRIGDVIDEYVSSVLGDMEIAMSSDIERVTDEIAKEIRKKGLG
ncbi:hypothetical protein EHEL_050740 [Encephalitozoon hellem ATCC 50504]|uniref:Baculoviral inhibition of apoptosis protein repeat domain-containing protein n=1 Tax=Encephalitozoon hellem TaxID=27973 RepID=A0A9Q9F9I5_ENCHE|nr:uncharacterized protein EHEL_050740 [Encephalitozoon hellem ATCC 50504]AFM98284.1 hypothetical protein EHEL_050740 [Encephalitozoon hellem ATCC 50504]UTX43162.1 baculoviral inhibition of apoptosis protein repeat domain-containing protein [Encephalitozoon hellem]WEL38619.1 baculoviral inhibition of apoptosis protein repeat domain-containing protein [Encephalitozoon hellem]|eukprot:XP_003887265.1 hypothetical protein EHEL_050740 [Encephalitozoon hellem ATCC 50504]